MREQVRATPVSPAPAALIQGREATIKTAQITIKTMTVSGRQVTLALFKQLLYEDLIDPDDAYLRGPCWGTVNYFWGNCYNNHLHAVWQRGDELRRACVYPRPDDRVSGRDNRLADRDAAWEGWAISRFLAGELIGSFVSQRDDSVQISLRLPSKTDKVVTMPESAYTLLVARRTIADHSQGYDGLYTGHLRDEYHQKQLRDAQEKGPAAEARLRDWLSRMYSTDDVTQLEQEYDGTRAELEDFSAAWRKCYDIVAATDQLFIAT